jgi:glycosyltransferase involved in cell wall biosynthesis
MYRGLRVAVVIPAFNESKLLPQTLAGLPRYVDHVLVVDDASTDRTAVVARRRGPWALEVIRHAANLGVGGAIVTGYRRALRLGVDAAVVVGADAQMDPHEMHRLLDALVDDGADYAKGDRLGHAELWRRMPWIRLFGNLALTLMTRLASGYGHIRDSQCGYTAIGRRALLRLPLGDLYPRYGFPNDLLAKLGEIDAHVVDRPVTPIYGEEVSRLRIPRVMGPIFLLIVRSGARRWWRAALRATPTRAGEAAAGSLGGATGGS